MRVVVRIMVDYCYNMHMYKCTCNIINTVCIMYCMYTIPHMYSFIIVHYIYTIYYRYDTVVKNWAIQTFNSSGYLHNTLTQVYSSYYAVYYILYILHICTVYKLYAVYIMFCIRVICMLYAVYTLYTAYIHKLYLCITYCFILLLYLTLFYTYCC